MPVYIPYLLQILKLIHYSGSFSEKEYEKGED